MNIIDKKRMLNGLCYMVRTETGITEEQIDAIVSVRDILRKANLIAVADPEGKRIFILDRDDGTQIAVAMSL